MIGVTKLYCGTVEPSDLLRYGRKAKDLPSHLLQFSEDKKPVIVWNVTRACNLACRHCYASAQASPAPDELSPAQAQALVRDLTAYGTPVILFSGGEPLSRPDLPILIKLAVKGGSRAVLSTNGLLLDRDMAARLSDLGLSYVGISLDGLARQHDLLRRRPGAFQAALEGASQARRAGLKVGLRLTMTKGNLPDLGGFFDLLAQEGIPRACFYHLVVNPSRPQLAAISLDAQETREALDLIARRTRELHENGRPLEILTVDNQADGPYLWLKLRKEGRHREAAKALELLSLNGEPAPAMA
jgi:MoaA/NifB/PqqE/SkfB family radical SAM enzyme